MRIVKNGDVHVSAPIVMPREMEIASIDELKDWINEARKKTSDRQKQRAEFFDKLFDFSQVIEKEAATSKWNENVKFSIRNAQRLCENILQKQRNLAEFTDAISIQYLNDLSTDNDNSEKLEDFKNSKEIKEQIKQIYDLYDFAEEKVVDLSVDFDDLFSTTDGPDPKDGSAADKEEAMAKILDRFS
jgi:predicted metal-dependent hydrolase